MKIRDRIRLTGPVRCSRPPRAGRRHIAEAIVGTSVGGAERTNLLRLARVAEVADVTVLCLGRAAGIFLDDMRRCARVVEVDGADGAVEWVREHEPDALVSDICQPLTPYIAQVRPLVPHLSVIVRSLSAWSMQLIPPPILPYLDTVGCIAEYEVAGLVRAGVPREKICCVPRPPDGSLLSEYPRAAARGAHGIGEGQFALVYAGRADGNKGVLVLPVVLAALVARSIDARLMLVGMTEEGLGARSTFWQGTLDTLLAYAQSLGVADRITHVPSRADIADCYAAADVGVLLSKAEGLSNFMLETLGAGRPMVTTDVGDARRWATPETGSHVVTRGKAFAEEAVEALLAVARRGPAEVAAQAQAARQVVADGFAGWDERYGHQLLRVFGVQP